jgi:L-ascorbate metabolism protein UlaG (beta-lactamase superfamily)
MFNIGNIFSDPGDSFSFKSTKKILALPVQAPWGSLTQAVELAVSLKPEVIIPIHDWHWNEIARNAFYKRLEDYFKNEGINFISPQTGVEITI